MIVGVASTLVALFFLSVLRLFITRLSNRGFHQVLPYLRADDPQILGELVDPGLERQLSMALSRRQFRAEQLNRISLAIEHIQRRVHNAVIWQGWGDTERRKSRMSMNLGAERAAEKLVDACAEFRLGAWSILMQLYLWQFRVVLIPFASVPHIASLRRVDEFDLLESYERIKQRALTLAQACGGDYYQRLAAVL
jgi:hypothetical protein